MLFWLIPFIYNVFAAFSCICLKFQVFNVPKYSKSFKTTTKVSLAYEGLFYFQTIIMTLHWSLAEMGPGPFVFVSLYPCDFAPDYLEIWKQQCGCYDPVIVKERKRKEVVRDYIWNLCRFLDTNQLLVWHNLNIS